MMKAYQIGRGTEIVEMCLLLVKPGAMQGEAIGKLPGIRCMEVEYSRKRIPGSCARTCHLGMVDVRKRTSDIKLVLIINQEPGTYVQVIGAHIINIGCRRPGVLLNSVIKLAPPIEYTASVR